LGVKQIQEYRIGVCPMDKRSLSYRFAMLTPLTKLHTLVTLFCDSCQSRLTTFQSGRNATVKMKERMQSMGEEIANSVSHGVALLAAIVAVPFLILAVRHPGISCIVGAGVFALTMVLLFLTSTLYHALPASRAKRVVEKLDHGAIYLFIAGSYTPFALGALSDPWTCALFVIVWSAAILGAALKAFDFLSHPWLSTGLYLLMGWIVLIAAVPLVERVPVVVDVLLVAGGIAYTAGVVFFLLDSRLRYSHTVWHCFVIIGSGCHYIAVLDYAS
jgi:hemolysin III